MEPMILKSWFLEKIIKEQKSSTMSLLIQAPVNNRMQSDAAKLRR